MPAVEDAPNAIVAPHSKGHVEFNHVSFAYMPDPEDVKEGQAPSRDWRCATISFTIEPGEVVALVGGSGAGKSTIVQLLPRLYDPHAGTITIDGKDIRSFTLDSLRAQMSMVLQEAILFTGTRGRQYRLRPARMPAARRLSPPQCRPTRTSSSSSCPKATTPC